MRNKSTIYLSCLGQLPVSRTQSYDLVERANYFRSLFKLIPAKQCDNLSFLWMSMKHVQSIA